MYKLSIIWGTNYLDWILSILIQYNLIKSVYIFKGTDFNIWTSMDYFCINIMNYGNY